MKDEDKTKEQSINELVALRQRIAESEASQTQYLSTEQAGKRAEEALRESEERFQQVAENARHGSGSRCPRFTPMQVQ